MAQTIIGFECWKKKTDLQRDVDCLAGEKGALVTAKYGQQQSNESVEYVIIII